MPDSGDEATERVWPEGQADRLVLEVAHRDLPLRIKTILERVDRIATDDTLWQTIPPLYNSL